jgi:hypothetical protein
VVVSRNFTGAVSVIPQLWRLRMPGHPQVEAPRETSQLPGPLPFLWRTEHGPHSHKRLGTVQPKQFVFVLHHMQRTFFRCSWSRFSFRWVGQVSNPRSAAEAHCLPFSVVPAHLRKYVGPEAPSLWFGHVSKPRSAPARQASPFFVTPMHTFPTKPRVRGPGNRPEPAPRNTGNAKALLRVFLATMKLSDQPSCVSRPGGDYSLSRARAQTPGGVRFVPL